uniref:Uncharacterized protein n=1 Tax=Solanum lycopersicum TaxID=4081 RepID=A0A3Q7JKV6_SOLLC
MKCMCETQYIRTVVQLFGLVKLFTESRENRKKGCNYYGTDGTFICEEDSEYISKIKNDAGKACLFNNDPRISYEVCPRSKITNKINF